MTFKALEPLANSASVVSVCSAFRLAESADVERLPLVHDDPLIETSWQSSTSVFEAAAEVERRSGRCSRCRRTVRTVQFDWAT